MTWPSAGELRSSQGDFPLRFASFQDLTAQDASAILLVCPLRDLSLLSAASQRPSLVERDENSTRSFTPCFQPSVLPDPFLTRCSCSVSSIFFFSCSPDSSGPRPTSPYQNRADLSFEISEKKRTRRSTRRPLAELSTNPLLPPASSSLFLHLDLLPSLLTRKKTCLGA